MLFENTGKTGLSTTKIPMLDFLKYQGSGITGKEKRTAMVDSLGLKNEIVKTIMKKTPRHYFVDKKIAHQAYDNITLPIGFSQTISTPGIVGLMTEALMEKDAHYYNVLEVGTGCGYQSIILAQIFEKVYSIERIRTLHLKAKKRFKTLAAKNICCYHSDGLNLNKTQLFDAIIITAAPRSIPTHFINHLAKNGRLIAPEGVQSEYGQKLVKINFDGKFLHKKTIAQVNFVPLLTGIN